MLFNVNISPTQPGAPNFNVQVEAPDLVAALEAAKAPILKSAQQSAAILALAIPAAQQPISPPPAAPPA